MNGGTSMQAHELAEAWHAATEKLRVPADFVERVVHRGRWRSARRRVGLVAGGAFMVVTLAAAGIAVLGGGRPPVTDQRLAAPTRGDLAGDQQLLEAAVRVWREGITVSPNAHRGIFDDPLSDPHVYWAGTTPAGPAAVVMQAFYLHQHGNLDPSDANQVQTLVGLVGTDPASNELTLLGDQYRADGSEPGAFRFGPEDRTVLVVERSRPVYIATHRTLTLQGHGLRNWQPLVFTDGVAVFQVPVPDDPADIRLVERATPPEPTDLGRDFPALMVETASQYVRSVKDLQRRGTGSSGDDLDVLEELAEQARRNDHRLPWLDPACRLLGEPRPPIDEPIAVFADMLWEWGTIDPNQSSTPGGWCILVGIADGAAVLVSELQEDADPSRIYAVTVDAGDAPVRAQVGPEVDPAAPLPVAIKLDADHGWVVAAYGSRLSYRTTVDGGWTDGGTDAALLPDDAAQVRVTDARGHEVVVPLR